MLEGREPSVTRAAEIADALGLELYIGPPRDIVEPPPLPSEVELKRSQEEVDTELDEPGSEPIDPKDYEDFEFPGVDPEMRRWLRTAADLFLEASQHRKAVEEVARSDDSGASAEPHMEMRQELSVASGEGFAQVRRPDPDDVRLAAGTGAIVDREKATTYIAFRRSWLRKRHLRAQDLILVDVWGESMVPTIQDGDVALVDESHDRPRSGRIYALRTPDGLVVKRLRQRKRRWWADSDNPDHVSREMSDGDEIVGRVVWWAHTEAK